MLTRVLGAFSVGTPDCVSHIAEEIPRPDVNVPKAIAAQMGKFPLQGPRSSISDLLDLSTSSLGPFPSCWLPPHHPFFSFSDLFTRLF